jgi:3-dehydroquinate dehydratase/shikimate dehydrogenase
MGEYGLMSRVLAPKFGGYLTFASLRDTTATAPGQPTIRELLDLYRFRSINSSTPPTSRVTGS